MSSEWETTTLGTMIELKRGYDLPAASRRPGPYPVVSSSGPTDMHAEFKARAPGVVTGRYGTIGEVYYITTNYWPLNTALYVRDFKGNDPRFISYFLRGIDFASYSDKSAVPGVNRNHLHQAKVKVPPLPVQRRIADILGKLDDKIELNRRMNRTLEEMAAAIFKSWFIDFDPVHAKAEGRDPNLRADIADLFPDTFEDSDLGPIPKGWTRGQLADIAKSPRRTVQPSDVPPATPYIGLQNMPRRCIALDAWSRANEANSAKSQFKEGEVLFGKLRPYFHKVGIAPVDGVCSTDILIVVPKSPEWHSYVLSLVSSKAFVDYTDSHSAGTKMPRTNWKDMSRYPVALPPEPLAKAFQDHVAALHQRIGLAVRQNRRLASLRDTLLPKLLSGETELPAAEATAEEVS